MANAVGSNDAEEGRTIFIRNLNFDTDEEQLRAFFEEFGDLEYAKVVVDRLTERPRGSAFIKFLNKADADKALLEADADPARFELDGRVLALCMAVTRSEAPKAARVVDRDRRRGGNRNLHLARAGEVPADELSQADREKRAAVDRTRAEKLLDPTTFISPLRLCVRNIPATVGDRQLKGIFIKAGGVDCRVTECRIMRDRDRVNAKGVAKSRGYAFVAFDEHQHALQALKRVNNSPEPFSEQKRLIVEFSVESRAALDKKMRRAELSRKRLAGGDGEEEPVEKRKKDLIAASLQTAPNPQRLPSSLPTFSAKKKRRRRNAKVVPKAAAKPKTKLSRRQARDKRRGKAQ